MKQVQVKSVGVTYTVEVPESAEEYDQLAKKQGACVEAANANVIYRSLNAQFRSQLADAIEEETGHERATKVTGTREVEDEDGNKTTEDIVEYAETEKKFLDRVYAEEGLETEEQRMARFGELIKNIQASLVFDPSERERSAGPAKKARKLYREAAEAIEEAAGESGLETAAGKLSDLLGYEVPATVEGVALAIQAKETRNAADIAQSLL